jgi:hypothetical protein
MAPPPKMNLDLEPDPPVDQARTTYVKKITVVSPAIKHEL